MNCKICNQKLRKEFKGLFDDRHGYPGRFNVLKCSNCEFMQTDPQLATSKLYKLYTNYYPKRDANINDIIKYAKNMPSKKEIALKGLSTTCHFLTKKGQNVLDVGCGTCQSLLEIKRLGGKAWGLDVDSNSQKVAKILKLNFHRGTIHNCKFPKNSFDLITVSQVIEHEPDPIKFLRNCKIFLSRRGQIILSFPNTNSLGFKIWGRNWLHWHIPYHLNHFSKKSLKLMVEKSGFEIISLNTITPNLWTVLQFRSYISDPTMGIRNTMWDGQPSIGSSKKMRVKTKVILMMAYLVENMLFVNRIVDYFGFGESFVVKLRSSEKQI